MGVAAALRLGLEPAPPDVREPFELALRAFDLNTGLAEALATARISARDRRIAISIDALSLIAGEDLSSSRAAVVIGAVADRLAFEARVREEIDARASGVRWQIALLALLVPALALYLVVTMPGLAATLASPLGTHVLIPAAAALEIVGIAASRMIVRGLAL